MKYQGVLKKMLTENLETIQYYLDMGDDVLHVNQLLDKTIEISFVKYECLSCKKNNQIYRQGFCKSCFFETPNAGDWIIRPELSKAHLGIEDRDLAFEKEMQLKPHIVYLAFSSNVKVGVTRKTQIPTRWIDQGAIKAMPIVEVPNRYLAGITEIALKEHVADKTNWRKMLQGTEVEVDLNAVKQSLAAYIPDETREYFIENDTKVTELNFPVLKSPEKVKSLNLVKSKTFSGTLKGVKGQYFIFEDDTVFNIRSNEGLFVSITI